MRTQRLVSSLLVVFAAASVARAQYFEARNMGMGGTGVASSRYLAAGFANPALLTRFTESDRVGLILPTIGAVAYDKTNLLDDVKAFVDEYDRLNNNVSATPQEYVALAQQLQALSGRDLVLNFGLGFALAMPSKDISWSLHLHSYADLQGVMQFDPTDLTSIGGTTPGGALPDLSSEVRIVGAAVSEIGFSVAKRFEVSGLALSVGATPKYQRVDTYNYSVNAQTFELDNFDSSEFRADEGNFNLDLGVSFEPGMGITLGAMGRDLIANDYDTVLTQGERFTYEVAPNLSLGAAWQLDSLTLSGEVDITRKERFKDQVLSLASVSIADDVQYARFGAELDVLKWLQLRGGLQTDLKDHLQDAYTAGVGLSPFDLLHVDVAGIYVDKNSYGGVVQLSFTF